MYDALSQFAQTWGLLLFILLFAGVLVYALWPGNRERFRRAARMPLSDADRPEPSTSKPSNTDSEATGTDETKDRNHG